MLRCSKCGTLNTEGNIFCSSCGSKLDRTSIRCPKCGTMNAVGNIFCENCQTQLVSPDAVVPPAEEDVTVTPVKGISLPTRDSSDDEPLIPEWLQQLTDDVQAESVDEFVEEGSTGFTSDIEDSYEIPEWLSGQDALSPVDSGIERLSQSDTSSNAEDLPDWLSADSDDFPEVEKLPASEPKHSNQDAPVDSLGKDAATTEMPDWLTVIADEIDASASTPSSAPAIPEWLASIAEETEASPTPKSDQPLPDWLKPEDQTSSGDLSPDVSEQTKQFTDEISLETEPDEFIEVTKEDAQPEALIQQAEYEQSLQDIITPDAEEFEPTLPIQPLRMDQADDDINLTPDWLLIPVSDIEAEKKKEEDEEYVEAEEETGVPDWLSTLGEQTPEADQTTTPKLSTETVAAGKNLPSWLSDVNIPHEVSGDTEAVFPSESAEAITAETQQQETPAWLDEVSPPPEAIAITPATPAFIPSEEEQQQANEQDLNLEPAEDDSFPSWLNELRLPEPDETISDSATDAGFGVPVSGFFGDIDQIMPEVTEDLARAEVPEWLHDLRPPSGSQWPPQATISSTELPGIDAITPAEVPDWVQSLKPKPGEEKEKTPERILPPEPAEIEGPLTSLAGILPSTVAVDMPADHVVKLVNIPDNVIKQAQLWQQLLGQPRSAVRKVAHRRTLSGISSPIMRILITAIFVLGSLAALWLLPPSNLTVTASMENTPGPYLFVDSVDALQPGATVVLALEYGWAQAEEMNAIANAVLQHLQDQKANIIAVSTMPEGTAIIPHLLESNALSNTISGNAFYLSGSSSGIAGLLGELDTQSASMLIVLSSHYERIRWWIEQNQIAASANANIPLLVNIGLSASVAPLTAPYLNEHNTNGWMIGYQDALNYQALRGIQNAEQTRILNVVLIMHWAAIILLIIGFLYTLVTGKKRVA